MYTVQEQELDREHVVQWQHMSTLWLNHVQEQKLDREHVVQ